MAEEGGKGAFYNMMAEKGGMGALYKVYSEKIMARGNDG